MVECEECGEWYHDECIGLTEEETYNIETYYCAPCCSSNCDLVTKYKEDPVKLRQQIIDQVIFCFSLSWFIQIHEIRYFATDLRLSPALNQLQILF